MKRRLFSLIELLLNWVVMTLYTKPKCICALFSHKEYWSHASYFPEKKSKPQCRVFFEQLKYIKRWCSQRVLFYVWFGC